MCEREMDGERKRERVCGWVCEREGQGVIEKNEEREIMAYNLWLRER